jgi:hypothetical protein
MQQDSLKKEEDMKRELKMRLALAGFLQDTLQEMARKKKTTANNDEQQVTVLDTIHHASLTLTCMLRADMC